MKSFASAIAICLAPCAGTADSQTFTTLVQFTGTGGTASGWNPIGSLMISGTALYGMTFYGGGNIFSVGTDGANYQNLVSFSGGVAGGGPEGSLTLDGMALYGMRA